ncbi:hypothetical protein LTR85_004951 [Meristemomyces frigidus]|nr:hypothetical protein LTR85_004951 [Meristemomyces frigidus]
MTCCSGTVRFLRLSNRTLSTSLARRKAFRNLSNTRYNIDYQVPGSSVVIPGWRPMTASFDQLRAKASDAQHAQLLQAKTTAFNVLKSAFSSSSEYRVDWHPLQPIKADAQIHGPDGSCDDVELKIRLLKETSDNMVELSIFDWSQEDEEEGVEGFEVDLNTRKARANPFHPARSYSYLFTINQPNTYGYFLPKSFIQKQAWNTAGNPVRMPRGLIAEFRINLRNTDHGRTVTNIVRRYAKQQLPSHRDFFDSLRQPLNQAAPTTHAQHFQLSLGPLGSSKHYGPWWLFERVVTQLALLGVGLLLPIHRYHPRGNYVLVFWTWTAEQVERWLKYHEMPTGIGMPGLPLDDTCVFVRMINAATTKPSKGNEKAITHRTTRDRMNNFEKHSLVILDQYGHEARNLNHGYHLIPSELIVSTDRRCWWPVLLRDSLAAEQFLVDGGDIGRTLMSFLQSATTNSVPWIRPQVGQTWRQDILNDKGLYFTVLTGMLQTQVSEAWYLKKAEQDEAIADVEDAQIDSGLDSARTGLD